MDDQLLELVNDSCFTAVLTAQIMLAEGSQPSRWGLQLCGPKKQQGAATIGCPKRAKLYQFELFTLGQHALSCKHFGTQVSAARARTYQVWHKTDRQTRIPGNEGVP